MARRASKRRKVVRRRKPVRKYNRLRRTKVRRTFKRGKRFARKSPFGRKSNWNVPPRDTSITRTFTDYTSAIGSAFQSGPVFVATKLELSTLFSLSNIAAYLNLFTEYKITHVRIHRYYPQLLEYMATRQTLVAPNDPLLPSDTQNNFAQYTNELRHGIYFDRKMDWLNPDGQPSPPTSAFTFSDTVKIKLTPVVKPIQNTFKCMDIQSYSSRVSNVPPSASIYFKRIKSTWKPLSMVPLQNAVNCLDSTWYVVYGPNANVKAALGFSSPGIVKTRIDYLVKFRGLRTGPPT